MIFRSETGNAEVHGKRPYHPLFGSSGEEPDRQVSELPCFAGGHAVRQSSALSYGQSGSHQEASRDAPANNQMDPAEHTAEVVAAAKSEATAAAREWFEGSLAERLGEERAKVQRMREEFARDRQRFFAAAESQVVKLALAIARRILARDAISEGLQLRATVKSALSRVQDGGASVLRVPEEETAAWIDLFGKQGVPRASGRVDGITVVGDERMSPGECVLETSLGNVELGVEIQMAEVKRGFGELLQGQGSWTAG